MHHRGKKKYNYLVCAEKCVTLQAFLHNGRWDSTAPFREGTSENGQLSLAAHLSRVGTPTPPRSNA